MDVDQPLASGSSSPKRTNVIYVPNGDSFSAIPQAPLSPRPQEGRESVICIDNGKSAQSLTILWRLIRPGSHSWRAGYAGSSEPYIDKNNLIARYKERKVGKNIMLFGKDVEADSNSRSNVRSMFDGDMLIHADIMVSLNFNCSGGKSRRSLIKQECALDYTFHMLGIGGDRVDCPVVMTERLSNPLFTRASEFSDPIQRSAFVELTSSDFRDAL